MGEYQSSRFGALPPHFSLEIISSPKSVFADFVPVFVPWHLYGNVSRWYYNYIFRLPTFYRSLIGIGKGILFHETESGSLNTIRLRIAMTNLNNEDLPLPPRDEQDQVVRYLDWKVSGINRLINAKRRQIALLQEQKRAVVNSQLYGERVWLKRLITSPFQYGANDSGMDFSPDLPRYVRITDISNDGNLKEEGKKSLNNITTQPYILSDGDILFARSGATSGKTFLYKKEYGLCAFAGYLIRAKLDTNKILPGYLMYVTDSSDYEEWKNSIFIQSTIQNISAERYSQLPIPLPSLDEQNIIISLLNKQCERINRVISKLNTEIALFTEYRTRLVSDVVTGKLDVRGVVVPEFEAVEDFTGEEETCDMDIMENEE